MRKLSPPSGFDPRTVQPVTSRYTDWAIPAHRRRGIITKFGIDGSAVNKRLHCHLVIRCRSVVICGQYHRSSELVVFWQFVAILTHWLKFVQIFFYFYWCPISTVLGKNQQTVLKFPNVVQQFFYHLAAHNFCRFHIRDTFLVHVLIRTSINKELIQLTTNVGWTAVLQSNHFRINISIW